jgi:hypothetical protein
MSFNNEDILILAKAGFTAQQIAALNTVAPAPAPAPEAPAPVPEAPAPAPEAPAPAPEAQAPAPAPAATMDEILKSVQGLTQTFQNGFIMGAQQPKPVTAEEILANIINPPSPKKEV